KKSTPTSRLRTKSSPASRDSRSDGSGTRVRVVARMAPGDGGVCVLGVDPGTRLAGYAVLMVRRGVVECRDLGTIVLPAAWPWPGAISIARSAASSLPKPRFPCGPGAPRAGRRGMWSGFAPKDGSDDRVLARPAPRKGCDPGVDRGGRRGLRGSDLLVHLRGP